MSNILILEDSQERIKQMRRKLIGHNCKFTETASECIRLLENCTWDIVCLDHDLGGTEMVESGPGTGYEVAQWLGANPDKQPKQIILHSWNTIVRQRMKSLLPNAEESMAWWT